METLFNSFCNRISQRFCILATAIIILADVSNLQSVPQEWMYYFEDIVDYNAVNQDPMKENPAAEVSLALSCKPEVNVSLGTQGYAVLTAIMLVNAPDYPAFLYDVDIMGPLNDTVFCEQIGQELMVVVTELPTGNSCMSTVFVEDKLKPVFSCTPDTLPCTVTISEIDFENFVEVTDNCDDDLTLFFSYAVQNLPCNPNGLTQQILILWTAIDDSGNSATCQDIIYLQRPSLSEIDFPNDTSVSCLNPNIDPSVTGVPTINGDPIGIACQLMVFHTDQVVPMCNGAQKIIRVWTVMDICTGAQISDVQEILIVDNIPPVLTCPANLTIGTDPGVCTTKYTLPFPVVTDACSSIGMIDIDIFVSSVPGIFSPGQMINLGLGVTTITIRATDPCNNSSMCSYMVTVKDNTPPIPICHSLTVGLGADGMATIFANLLDFPIIENCGILSKQIWRMTNTCGVPEDLLPGPDVKFCCADAGDTLMVAFKVTDLSGNMNTCMFQVIVKDQLPPVVDCEDLTISITNQGTIVIDPADVVNQATDNCFVVDTFVTPGIFDCTDIGPNVVVVTVTDQSGNTSTCTATVTIVDEVPPVALCQNVTVTLNAMGTAVISATQINNGSTDNCVIDTIFLNQYEFDCDDAGIQVVQLTVEDEAGNTATCTATVTVLTTPPVAICQNITVFLDETGTVTIVAIAVNNGSFDDCGIDSFFVTPPTFDCTDLGPNVVTLTVTDDTGNSSTCTAIVTVEDTIPPIALCQDISIMLDENGMAVIVADSINNGSTDNCFIVDIEIDSTEFNCEEAGDNIVTLTVTDQSGNTSTCTATVMVMMPDPPTALCQDITVTLGPGGIVVITPEQIDDGSFAQCGDVTLTIDADTFDCEDLGSGNVVTLTVTDETFTSSTCTATVTILENPPVAICQNITVSLIGNTVTITGEQVNNNSTDDCGIVDYDVTPALFDCSDLGPNQVVLTVTDESGNTSTCTAIVTVQDNTVPVAVCQDITVSVDADGIVIVTGISINNGSSDNCGMISLTATPDTLTCEDLGINTVVLTVTDQSGNSSTCTATVTVTLEPPIAVCQDITVTLGSGGIVVIEAIDVDGGSLSNCDSLGFSVDQDTFDCTDLGDNVVILTVTDVSGNTSTCTSTVTITDETAPICSADDLTVFVDGTGNVSILPGQINDGSTDNCTILSLSVTPDDFTCEDLGPNTVILTVTDQSGNSSTCTATVTVIDNIDPICSAQDITVEITGSGTVTILASQVNDGSSDNCGSVTLDVDPEIFDCGDLGANTVTLTVTDESNNSSTCTATVTVISVPPSATCQDITVSLGPDGIIIIDAIDVDGGSGSNCGNIIFSVDQDTFDCTELGENIVILTVSDGSGASSTCTATVTVVDDTDPICSADNLTVFVDDTGNVSILPGQINDGSTDNCTIITVDVTPADFDCGDLGPNTVILTVTDQSGNSSTCTSIVTVVDTISPICNAQDITVTISGTSVTITAAQVNDGSTDNCGPITLGVDPAIFDCDDLGPNMVVLTVTDGSANSSTCTATVTVTESGGLVANCQNVTIFLDANGNASVDPEDIDNGSGGGCTPGILTFELTQTQFNCTDLGPNIVILTVTDSEGNSATCTAVITVVDNMPPTISCPPNLTVECSSITNPNNTSQFGNATANDNCPPVNIQENAVFNLNDCNVGTITRTFTATDGSGNTSACVQVVTFVNTNPFTEDDITWPPASITINICNSTLPQNIPNGQPVFDPASLQCANPVATFSDQVQTFPDNNPNTICRVITRTWTVTDNCQPNGTFVFVQTINVADMVPPLFTNINDMTKVANANCVAFFTLIASATDCAGVTITNNSPFGVNTGANASGNYPIGQTTVIFTATDGCGNISTMDVVVTVTDPNPTGFQCEKVIVILPEETEITLNAETFVLFLPGNCTDQDDFIVSYSRTDPFDTTNVYDCGDVGVTTFPLWFWNLSGTALVDSCSHADLDLRDPDDHCMDGLILMGNVESEDGLAVSGVDVHVTNAPMLPGTTNTNGEYLIEGFSEGIGYEIAPFKDIKHRVGVSTLDLVLIQKHLLGRAKLNSPYKMIAADANKSGHISGYDLLEIRKLILGINSRFPNNTSWRFIDRNYTFIDPYNPFNEAFSESIWVDSVTAFMSELNFIGVKIGDVNGSYFLAAQSGSKIEPRSDSDFNLGIQQTQDEQGGGFIIVKALDQNSSIDGIQFSLNTGGLTTDQVKGLTSEILTAEQWYYDPASGMINISWTTEEAQNIHDKMLIKWPCGESDLSDFDITSGHLNPEAYDLSSGVPEVKRVVLSIDELFTENHTEYHLFQNKPNPFADGTVISFILPEAENIRLAIYDITGRQVFEHKEKCQAGRNEVIIRSQDLKTPGIYYYTLHTGNASFTRKMSFTIN